MLEIESLWGSLLTCLSQECTCGHDHALEPPQSVLIRFGPGAYVAPHKAPEYSPPIKVPAKLRCTVMGTSGLSKISFFEIFAFLLKMQKNL